MEKIIFRKLIEGDSIDGSSLRIIIGYRKKEPNELTGISDKFNVMGYIQSDYVNSGTQRHHINETCTAYELVDTIEKVTEALQSIATLEINSTHTFGDTT